MRAKHRDDEYQLVILETIACHVPIPPREYSQITTYLNFELKKEKTEAKQKNGREQRRFKSALQPMEPTVAEAWEKKKNSRPERIQGRFPPGHRKVPIGWDAAETPEEIKIAHGHFP